MASCNHLFEDAQHIIQNLVEENELIEYERNIRFHAALVIQKAWHQRKIKFEFVDRRQAAVCIQRWVRGHLVRINISRIIRNCIYEKRKSVYTAAAIKIQALWRGYQLRKKNNFHRDYMHRIQIQRNNIDLMNRMQEDLKKAEEIRQARIEMEAKNMILFIIFKLHHNLRTYSKEGVYSDHGTNILSKIEKLLASVKYTEYMNKVHAKYNKTYKNKIPHFMVPSLKTEENLLSHKKPFSYDSRINVKYEKALDNGKRHEKRIKHIERSTALSKHVHEKDFDVTAKKVELKSDPPPYYVDFWRNGCEIHDIEDKFE